MRDIRGLLLPEDETAAEQDVLAENVVRLWDGSRRTVAGGTDYGEEF